jgi:protocatechuate 4,5-dioxygenase alpha subunit
MNPQLQGIEEVPGTYVFDIRQSTKALRLNRFFWGMTQAEKRELFQRDEEAAYEKAGLDEEEKTLVRKRDWLGLIRYGVNFFVLEKFARVVRMTNLEVYAAMRGETLEEFLKTRQVPDVR